MRFCSYCARLHTVAERDLGELGCETQGVLLALVSLAADESVLDVLAGEDREQCSHAWRALEGLAQDVRERTLSDWRMQASSGLPRGLERLHPSWIESALAGEPPDLLAYFRKSLPEGCRGVVEALMRGADAPAMEARLSPAFAFEVERAAFGNLAQLCDGACGSLAVSLCGLGFEALHAEVIRTGARTLGQSLAGTDAVTRAHAMALAGEPWAQVIADASAEKVSDDDRRAARVHAATNVHASAGTPSDRLLHIGLAVLRERLLAEHVGSVFRVAGRLPAALGRQLLDL